MSEEKDEIKDLFSSAFEDFEAEVDDKVWMNIEKELHPDSKRRFVWWRWAAAASIIGGISIFALLNLPADKEPLAEQKVAPAEIVKSQEDIVKHETQKINTQVDDQLAEQEGSSEMVEEELTTGEWIDAGTEKHHGSGEEIKYSGSSKINLAISSVPIDAGDANTTVELSNNINESMVFSTLITTVTDLAAIIDEDTTKADSAANLAIIAMPLLEVNDKTIGLSDSAFAALLIDTGLVTINEPILIPEPDVSKWLIAANFLSGGGSTTSEQTGSESMDNTSSSTTNLIGPSSTSQFTTLQTQTSTQPEFGDIRYSPPLITSITVNFRFSRRWSLESGLSYTVLFSSRETTVINHKQTKLNAKLQYLGIPLLLNFDIVSGEKFTWYTSFGAMVEKGLNARYITVHLSNGETINEVRESYPLEGLDVSAIFGMGIDYNINKLLSYYLQPGLSAYFVTNGSPYNPRVSRSVWPNIQTGLRFHF